MGARPYPYILHRAHEIAVVKFEEKKQVEQMLELELRRAGGELEAGSNKQSAKDLPGKRKKMNDVKIITVTEADLGKIQMFCGHSPTYRRGYDAKLEWLQARLQEGMRYTLLQVNGHNAGLIEYIPGEFAWRGVEAEGYLFIHCFWVIGRNRGHGYGRQLLETCLDDARGTNGVAVMVSKTHWLPTPKLFLKNGFELADQAAAVFRPAGQALPTRGAPAALQTYCKEGSERVDVISQRPVPLHSERAGYYRESRRADEHSREHHPRGQRTGRLRSLLAPTERWHISITANC